jgi:hypothetical protein
MFSARLINPFEGGRWRLRRMRANGYGNSIFSPQRASIHFFSPPFGFAGGSIPGLMSRSVDLGSGLGMSTLMIFTATPFLSTFVAWD